MGTYEEDLVRQWEENGRDDSLFDEDSLTIIHACAGSGWNERTTGFIDGHHEVTFRVGTGMNKGHTLISDGGHQSARTFDRHHDHYGSRRETNGRVEDNGGHRGNYSGPGK